MAAVFGDTLVFQEAFVLCIRGVVRNKPEIKK